MSAQATNGSEEHELNPPRSTLLYDIEDSDKSALQLVYWIRPKWREFEDQLKIQAFTEGITNTLLCIYREEPGSDSNGPKEDAILMRAYGNGTEVIIDRDREAASHNLLAQYSLAPPLLGRFKNGLLYGFIPGTPCKAEDLAQPRVWKGVARRLAQWHAEMPISGITTAASPEVSPRSGSRMHHRKYSHPLPRKINERQPMPNIWSVMRKWIGALDVSDHKKVARQNMLQREMERSFDLLDRKNGSDLGEHGFVFAHCDLLCANVIQLPNPGTLNGREDVQPVSFIDYEYATPAPAAFDIANHFAEFAGYDCDYSKVPTRSMRRGFIKEYMAAYRAHSKQSVRSNATEELYEEVDLWRGIPGLYWGVWALIQARISKIDFNYSKYAEDRLSEYFAWRGEYDGTRIDQDLRKPLRERTWAQD